MSLAETQSFENLSLNKITIKPLIYLHLSINWLPLPWVKKFPVKNWAKVEITINRNEPEINRQLIN